MSGNKRKYSHSELEEDNKSVPGWLILLYICLAVFFVAYLVIYFY
jgi:hypothetical protein